MRIDVAQKQRALKKQHGSCPNRWTATKPRQNKLANQWLNLEEQKRTYENGEGQ